MLPQPGKGKDTVNQIEVRKNKSDQGQHVKGGSPSAAANTIPLYLKRAERLRQQGPTACGQHPCFTETKLTKVIN